MIRPLSSAYNGSHGGIHELEGRTEKLFRHRRGRDSGASESGGGSSVRRRLLRQTRRYQDHQRRGHVHGADSVDYAAIGPGGGGTRGGASGSPGRIAEGGGR